MTRTLESGATTYCKVIRDYDDTLTNIAENITRNTDMVGSFNIQSIVDDNNMVHPFEINCRISGTNSIRSHFGFKDVIKEMCATYELQLGKVIKNPMEGLVKYHL